MAAQLSFKLEKKEFRRDDGTRRIIAEKFALEVNQSEAVSLVAPSGCGKSTLLRLIAGLDDDFLGSVHVSGVRITHPGRAVHLLDQSQTLLPWLTVAGNLRFAARRKPDERTNPPAELLERLGLSELSGAWPKDLSGGQRARVAFAMSVVEPPEVLLLDEPFRGLDIENRQKLHQHVRESADVDGCAIVIASHRITDAVAASDRVIVLGGEPMAVRSSVDVALAHPRDVGSQEVAAVAAEVRQIQTDGMDAYESI